MSITTIRSVAVIGAGHMGGGIARNLARSGSFDVRVSDHHEDNMRRCTEVGAVACASIRDAITGADAVITCLPMPQSVEEVFQKYVDHSDPDAVWIDVSTIDPQTVTSIKKLVIGSGRRFAECPLGKGPAEAEAGTLPLFVGCEEALLPVLQPAFACIGENVHYLGLPETAAAFKIVSNMIGMTNLAVLAEGYTVCKKLGASDEVFLEALKDTGGWSYQANLRLPWMMAGDFENRFGVDLAVKDVRLAVTAAAQNGVSVPVAAAGLMQYVQASCSGWGKDDVDAVARVVDPTAR